MWNPFRAVGDSIGSAIDTIRGIFTHEEVRTPEPEPTQATPEAPTVEPEQVAAPEPEPEGFHPFRAIGDAIRGIFTHEEARTPEPEPTQATPEAPTVEPEQVAAPEPEQVSEAPVPTREEPEPLLPRFVEDTASYWSRDERAFGIDHPVTEGIGEAAAGFIAERGGLDGLTPDAREWLQNPVISEIFDKYWVSGGFSADQVLAGMQNISNIQIRELDDGSLDIEFDYEADVDGYEIAGHTS